MKVALLSQALTRWRGAASGGPPTARNMKKAAPKKLAPTHVCIHTPRLLRPSVISGCSIKGESAIWWICSLLLISLSDQKKVFCYNKATTLRRRRYFFVRALKRINKARWGKKIKGLSSGFSSDDVLRASSWQTLSPFLSRRCMSTSYLSTGQLISKQDCRGVISPKKQM